MDMNWVRRTIHGIFNWLRGVLYYCLPILFFPITFIYSVPILARWYKDSSDPSWARLRDASTYEDWEDAGVDLDRKYMLNEWRTSPISDNYAWELIRGRLGAYQESAKSGEVKNLVNLLQSGLVRNLGNIANPPLYNISFVGTKHLIEHYTLTLCNIISDLANLPYQRPIDDGLLGDFKDEQFTKAVNKNDERLFLDHEKRELFNRLRLTYGKTALVFQGGSVFGLCHLGVARALFLRNLLPKTVVGTGVGALIAALIGVKTDEELPGILDGTAIDLSAFRKAQAATKDQEDREGFASRSKTLWRRFMRFLKHGYFLDINVLERLLKDNGGDITFEEAWKRTNRNLSITVVPDRSGAVPRVFNHITTPHVVIWTAAVASNASSDTTYGPGAFTIKCKRGNQLVAYKRAEQVQFLHWSHGAYGSRHYPLQEVSRNFQINHYIISQARPYLVPFVRPSMHSPTPSSLTMGWLSSLWEIMGSIVTLTVRYQAEAALKLGLLSASVRRLFLDEKIPAPHVTLVPDVRLGDYWKLLDAPTPASLRDWVLIGERAVWPAVAALKIRCSVERQLEQTCEQL